MKYEGYMVGPALRKLRTDRGLSILQASNLTGLSTSSLNQIEQGGRNLSMKSLFLFMNAYERSHFISLRLGRAFISYFSYRIGRLYDICVIL